MDVKVSIVIPTYNRKELLRKTLESLFDQTYPKDKYEIIVCDDGSSDGTEEMVKEQMKKAPCVLKYYKQKNKGAAAARNLGIKYATNEIIGFTDDDCCVTSTWIENAIKYLEKNKNICGVVGKILPLPYNKKFFYKAHMVEVTKENGSYCTGNIFYNKKPLLTVGGFDTEFKFFEDIELAWRLKENNYDIHYNENILVYHAVRYRSVLDYFRWIKNRTADHVLMYKKHPKRREELFLGFIWNKKNIYVIFTILYLISIIIYFNISYLFLTLAIISYLWAQVFTDSNLKKYPLRILLFPKNFVLDSIRLYSSLIASIRYRCLVLC
jgi:glycosyltransferase involved in cell wall biosynthesis